jgi:hypothetical protein
MPVGDRRAWADKAFQQLREVVPDLSHVIFLAGERYREFLARHLARHGIGISIPMKGLPIGKQLRWLAATRPGGE